MSSNSLQPQSGKTTLTSSIKASIAIAFERTQTEPYDITMMINDIVTEFPKLKAETIQSAIRKGSLGAYGLNYKVTTQVVCYWIREYVKEKNTNRLGL